MEIQATTIGAFAALVQVEETVYELLGAEFLPDQFDIVVPEFVALAAELKDGGPSTFYAGAQFAR